MFNFNLFVNYFKHKRKIISFRLLQIRNISNSSSSAFRLNEKGLKILFFGTDNFSLPSLAALHQENQKPNSAVSKIEVVTSFKSPLNRVKQFATKNEIKTHSWPIDSDLCRQFHLGIIVSFGHMIPSKIISSFEYGMINVHASLLPKWRGAAPIIYSILNGDTKTGVTIMKVEPKHFDIGAVLYQDECPIETNTLMPELHDNLAKMGANLLLKTIRRTPDCFCDFKPQNEKLATYAPKINLALTVVNWSEKTSKEVYNLFRAFYSFKNLSTKFHNLNIKIIDLKFKSYSSDFSSQTTTKPGFIKYSKLNKNLKVYCKGGDFIEITKLRLDGKKTISAEDFNNGFLNKIDVNKRFFQ